VRFPDGKKTYGNGRMVFVADLEYGREKERFAMAMFDYEEAVEAPSKKFPDWDFGLKGKGDDEFTYFEVKSDRMTQRTGNIAIEHMCNEMPSGIETTKSDWYLYFVEGERTYYEIPTDTIRQMIKENKWFKDWRGGDGQRALMYLFRRELFDEYKQTY